jgi:archaemetzincin
MKHIFILLSCFLFVQSCQQEHAPLSKKEMGRMKNPLPILLVYDKEVNKKYVDQLKAHLENAFPYKIRLKESPTLPKNLISPLRNNRYRADSILRYLNLAYKGNALKTILITHHGITCTKFAVKDGKRIVKEPRKRYLDWGIFGLGACPGYTCVVSTAFLWAGNATEKTFLQRLKNISVHELGHTFGLPHCPVKACVMNDANETIVTIDKSTGTFCDKCLFLLKK